MLSIYVGRKWSRIASGTRFRPQVDSLEDRILLTTLPNGFVETPVVSGLNRPIALEFAPDGRIFVALQGGIIRVVKNDQLLPTPFLDLKLQPATESGLLGIALDPNFATNPYVYIHYTVYGSSTHNRVSRFTANGDTVVSGSEVPLFDLEPITKVSNHNGGAIHFGPDGKLYIGVGDAVMSETAASLSTTFGKMLRINSDGSIPTDNPYYQATTGKNRAIWALGLRNPFSFAFQPGSGLMYINDPGTNRWEEIDVGAAGANFGWPATEGPTTDPQYRAPIYAYPHDPNHAVGAAITGGTFYNPPQGQFPGAAGAYFFTDVIGGWIHQLDPNTGVVTEFATGLPQLPVALGVDHGGSLYYLALGAGAGPNLGVLNKIQYPAATAPAGQAPTITRQPASVLVSRGASVVLSVEASGNGILAYQWLRNGAVIPGATGPTLTIPAARRNIGASYHVVISNGIGSVASQPATLIASSPYPRALYQAVFQRQPDPTALLSLTMALNQGVTPQQLALSLVTSPERRSEGVIALYHALLGRPPIGAEYTDAVTRLSTGTSQETLRAELLSSPEFAARHGGNPLSIVQSLFQHTLGRAPRRSEINQGVSLISTGGTRLLVDRLSGGNEAMRRHVVSAFTSYLQRRPNGLEVQSTLLRLRRGLSFEQAEANFLSRREFLTRSRGR